MPTIRLIDRGVGDLIRRGPARAGRAVELAVGDAGALILQIMTTYPPELPGQVYERTFMLRDSWGRESRGSGITARAIISSNDQTAPYNRLVQEEAQQARIHRNRWVTETQAVERSREQIDGFLQTRLRNEFGS